MPLVTVYKCDICGIERKEGNHWWMGGFVKSRYSYWIAPLWARYDEKDITIQYFCSEGHVFQAIRQWMQKYAQDQSKETKAD